MPTSTPLIPPECAHEHCVEGSSAATLSPANVVTAVRATASLVTFAVAVSTHSRDLLIASLLIYWIGDILDGRIARLTKTETRVGAIFDILCDRLGAATFYITWMAWNPDSAVAISIYLGEFLVVDSMLSLAFARWPIRSPNYFFRVDRLVWALNWSTPAKALNGAAVPLLLFFSPLFGAGIAASMILAVKVYSLARVAGLQVPEGRSECLASLS